MESRHESGYSSVVQEITNPDGTKVTIPVRQGKFDKNDPQKPLTEVQEIIAATAIQNPDSVYQRDLKPNVRKRIADAFEKAEVNIENVAKTHARNIFQEDSLSVSQAAIESYYKLTGITPEDGKANVNININVVEERVQKIFDV